MKLCDVPHTYFENSTSPMMNTCHAWLMLHLWCMALWYETMPDWVRLHAGRASVERIRSTGVIATTWQEVKARTPVVAEHPSLMTCLCYVWLGDRDACGGLQTREVAQTVIRPNRFEEHECSGWPTGRAETLAAECPARWIRDDGQARNGRHACACHARVVEA